MVIESLKPAFRDYLRIRSDEMERLDTIYPGEVRDFLRKFRPTDEFLWNGPSGTAPAALKRLHEDYFEFFEMEEKGELYARIHDASQPFRLLDAGCGIGGESIVFAMAGAEVIGVDLITDRLTAAKHRKAFFEKSLSRTLPIQFFNADLFKVLDSMSFQGVWIREAISHIHPLEDFLRHLYKRLPRGGAVFVSDANYLNPIVFKHVTQGFWNEKRRLTYYVHDEYKDPETHAGVQVAEERVFTPYGIRRVFSQAGFRIVRNDRLGFAMMRRRAALRQPDKLQNLMHWERLLGKIPVLNWFGGRNVVIAEKA